MNAEMRSKAVAHVIAGFLGAGKTTLLRHVLKSEDNLSGTAVIVNEFGTIGIDGTILSEGGVEVIELVNGCICCSLVTDLASTLEILRRSQRIHRIFIEATGLAEPSAIWKFLENESLGAWIQKGMTVGVLDGRMWKVRHHVGSFFLEQLKNVDIIILNKLDLMEEGQTAAVLEELKNEIGFNKVIPATFCNIDTLKIFKEIQNKSKNIFTGYLQNVHDFMHCEYKTDRTMIRQCIENVFMKLQGKIFRAKGPIRLSGQTLLFNYSSGHFFWEGWPRADNTCIVIIGRSIDFSGLKSELDACACGLV